MMTKSCFRFSPLFLGFLLIVLAPRLAAQSHGNIEFTARVSPAGGQPEPVRQMTFYLLAKSLEDIRMEAVPTAPSADLDKFIDGLDVSPELKGWMKKHRSLQLNGDDFTKGLSADDIVDVPEFFKAYMTHNAAFRGIGFPEPKFREKDLSANPEKYNDQKKEYEASVRAFIAHSPDTKQGMDLELLPLDPSPKWAALENKQRRIREEGAMRLAEERYLVARTDTDLDGHGTFAGIAPGKYWIGLLDGEAVSGGVHLRWDYPIVVRQGETARVELSNRNASRPGMEAQNSDR